MLVYGTGADPIWSEPESAPAPDIFFQLQLLVNNFGSGSTFKSSPLTGSGFKKLILILHT